MITDPHDPAYRSLLRRIKWLRRLTFLTLALERMTLACLPLLIWLCFFAGIWMTGLLEGRFLQASSILFPFGVVYCLYVATQRFSLPSPEETDRRLQEQSGVRHRPLSDMADRLPGPAPIPTMEIWGISREALSDVLKKLRPAFPRGALGSHDPLALRIGALVVLCAGLVMAGGSWHERLLAGLWPYDMSPAGLRKTDIATLTITPPDYTGLKTVILKGLSDDNTAPMDIAEGSTVEAHLTGGLGAATLRMGDIKMPLERLDKQSFTLKTTVLPGDEMTLQQPLSKRLVWPYRVVADTAPSIELDGEPAPLPRGELRVPLTLFDDYGVRDLRLRMEIAPSVTDRPLGESYEETRAVMTGAAKEEKLRPVYNLAFHPWAGLPVRLSFYAVDDKGQKAVLPDIKITLPERQFRNPIAAGLVEIRKQLAWHPAKPQQQIQNDLLALINQPDLYHGDFIVHLALSSALFRLAYSPGPDTAEALLPLLWDTAVHIEDGDTGKAYAELQDIREALETALNDPDATDEEIAGLMQQLQDAMQRYLQQMAQDMQRQGAPPALPSEMLSQVISPEDFEMFFSKLRAQALSGDKDAAREMLSRLSQMMDSLGTAQGPQQMPEDVQMMGEGLNRLKDLIDQQELLLDQTRAKSAQGSVPPQQALSALERQEAMKEILKQLGAVLPSESLPATPEEGAPSRPDTQKAASDQEFLRRDLGDLMTQAGEKLGQVPENMTRAEQHMRQSSAALQGNDPDQAIPAQEQALEQLKQAGEQMSQQLTQRLSEMSGFSMGGGRLDPLGRPYGDQGNHPLLGEKVEIPDQSERKRIKDILQTLRERSGQFGRSQEELDYYQRLLKQF